MEHRNRVVESLPVLAQNVDRAARFVGGAEEDVLEERLIDVVGARAGKQQRVGSHVGNHVPVELFVGAECLGHVFPFFHKGGRI